MKRQRTTPGGAFVISSNIPAIRERKRKQAQARQQYLARKAQLGGPISVPPRMNWNTPPECKQVDVSNIQLIPGVVAAVGTQLLNGTVNGAGPTQRLGRKISMLSYSYQLSLQLNTVSPAPASTTWRDSCIRFYIVYDREPTGSQPNFASVYTDVGQTGTTNVITYSGRNPNNTNRFLVLESKLIYVPQITTDAAGNFTGAVTAWGMPSGSGGNTEVDSRWNPLASVRNKKLNGLIAEYSGTTGGIVDFTSGSGSITMFACHSSAVVGAYPLMFQGSSRIRFIDA